jgi:hypothetical protein
MTVTLFSVVSFACYALVSLVSMIFGATYLLRSRVMPYHEEALGRSWQELDRRSQALLLGFMRAAGGGQLAGGLSLAILLLIPFRAGETWALYAVPAVGLAIVLPSLYATILVRVRTQARTPVWVGAAGIGLLVAGFVLSLI